VLSSQKSPNFESNSRCRAFTLIELLVVIAIIGILAGLIGAVAGHARMAANRAKCLSNQRQIGLALFSYANEHNGEFPPTTHTTGSRNKERSWIFELAPFLENVNEVRICPADPSARQKRIRDMNATSYLLNDLVFDSADFNRLFKIPRPSKTLLLAICSESRAPSITRDHIHGSEWRSYNAALSDIEADRHRIGSRAPNRLKGSANYLFADGHVENISAANFKRLFDQGINPAVVPTD
jgi:prepilin-type N-terminal cleavage/methylation domain-containing protein/prepilin-type processing-associated H-X9-DG protein